MLNPSNNTRRTLFEFGGRCFPHAIEAKEVAQNSKVAHRATLVSNKSPFFAVQFRLLHFGVYIIRIPLPLCPTIGGMKKNTSPVSKFLLRCETVATKVFFSPN